MNQLAGIFFHMDPGDADPFGFAAHFDIQITAFADRQVILRGLEVFRQVRIIVVLAVKFAVSGNFAIQSQAGTNRKLQHFFVQHRQYAGQSEADRADVRVLVAAEFGGAAAEYLGRGFQLRMDFQADYSLKIHLQSTSRIAASCL